MSNGNRSRDLFVLIDLIVQHGRTLEGVADELLVKMSYLRWLRARPNARVRKEIMTRARVMRALIKVCG